MLTPNLIFLKLGGSLITDKDRPSTPRLEILERLASEISAAQDAQPRLSIVLGHGSGSFGHTAARKHGTRQGVQGQQQWQGFAEVWQEARALNQIVVEVFARAGLPVVAFPPSAAVLARDGQIDRWDLQPLRMALENGLLPVINGDTIFDSMRGGTILSTEELFVHLAHKIQPARILLAGLEPGVWADFPVCSRVLPTITTETLAAVYGGIGGSASVDVTGGMRDKVASMLALAEEIPGFEAVIFSGLEPGLLSRVMLGEAAGTVLTRQA
jgi:isopentenyl phosphate kinase